MIFAVNGMVRWKKKKLANGVDGKFETNDERIIKRLQTLGFREWHEVEAERKALEAKVENKQPKTNQSVETETNIDQPNSEEVAPRKRGRPRKEIEQ